MCVCVSVCVWINGAAMICLLSTFLKRFSRTQPEGEEENIEGLKERGRQREREERAKREGKQEGAARNLHEKGSQEKKK